MKYEHMTLSQLDREKQKIKALFMSSPKKEEMLKEIDEAIRIKENRNFTTPEKGKSHEQR